MARIDIGYLSIGRDHTTSSAIVRWALPILAPPPISGGGLLSLNQRLRIKDLDCSTAMAPLDPCGDQDVLKAASA
jgi:hypothetical protein